MTPARRRLVALAAALAPRRARDLLARLADGSEAAGLLAAALAGAPRRSRLAALAAALPPPAARTEAGRHPLLARLAREPGRAPLAPAATSAPDQVRPAAREPDAARPGVRATGPGPGGRR